MIMESNILNLLNLVESRILEIKQIEEECKRKLPKLFAQRLPRYMRRRAASHNIKRLPRIARNFHSITKPKKKTPRLHLKRVHRKLKRKIKRQRKASSDKSLLHKWFAKRFKICSSSNIPSYNSTKNQRNLYRQSRIGCAFISIDFLKEIRIRLDGNTIDEQLKTLNRITSPKTGFTFESKALRSNNFDVLIYIYEIDCYPNKFICSARASLSARELSLWIPARKKPIVLENILSLIPSVKEIPSCDKRSNRIRLIGPKITEALSSIIDLEKLVILGNQNFGPQLGISIGRITRYVDEGIDVSFFNSRPQLIDIVLRGAKGKQSWYQLVKNKAHLVGGYRDVKNLLLANHPNLAVECYTDMDELAKSDLIRDEVILSRIKKSKMPFNSAVLVATTNREISDMLDAKTLFYSMLRGRWLSLGFIGDSKKLSTSFMKDLIIL